MLITRKSLFSGKERTLDLPITPQQLEDWTSRRKLIQEAMPDLTPDQREFLMTGTTPEEWNDAFPPEDEA
jgi:hypothetical protein